MISLLAYDVPILLFYAAPSISCALYFQRLAPRDGSLLARAATLAKVRASAVTVAFVVYVALAVLFLAAPESKPALPGRQYSAAFEAWQSLLFLVALAAIALGLVVNLVVTVVLVAELALLVRVSRVRLWVSGATPGTPHLGAVATHDVGVGDAWWARPSAGSAYREATALTVWARGTPTLGRALVGPIVSVSTLLVSLVCLRMTAMVLEGF